MESVEAHALPRVGLLGNPSDMYGGAVIAFTFSDFAARVRIERGPQPELGAGTDDARTFASWRELVADLAPRECAGATRLVASALRRFLARFGELASLPPGDPRCGPRISVRTDIPRQVGLAGSSAIVVATLRALCAWYATALAPHELALLALEAETGELGILAGPQDRLAQAHGGLVHMDFSRPLGPGTARILDPSLLPPLLVAWDPAPGRDSGEVHDDVHARWLAGDGQVRAAMASLPALVAEGLAALRARRPGRLRELVDANFDTRASIFATGGRDQGMVELGRGLGAGVKFCGSGGSVVCVVDRPQALDPLEAAYAAQGFQTLRPRIRRA